MTNIQKLNVVLLYLERGYTLPYENTEISCINKTFYAGKLDEKCFIIDPTISSLLKFVELLPDELIQILDDFIYSEELRERS